MYKNNCNMSKSANKIPSFVGVKTLLDKRRNFEYQESVFCTMDNLEESLAVLSEELDCLDNSPISITNKDLDSLDSLKNVLMLLINVSWKLVCKHRAVLKTQNESNDKYCRTISDNNNLKNQVKRLKEDLQKKEQVLCQTVERENRLKIKCSNMSRELKRQTDEVLRLEKQSQSKDIQHEHELRRVALSEHKLREQLHKVIGARTPTNKGMQNTYADQQEKEIRLYKQTIRRLEENNRAMLHEINELKEALALSTGGIDLQIEASGIWTDVET